MSKINVAIIGVGNCASSLVQGVEYYRNVSEHDYVPGLMHTVLGGYHIGDIKFVAGFDITDQKVGLPLNEAIYAKPNNTKHIVPPHKMPKSDAMVYRGMEHDGLGKYVKELFEHEGIKKAAGPTSDITQILKDLHTDVVLNYLPVGSETATKWYAEKVLEAGCAFVNCIPVFIASDERRAKYKGEPAGYWGKRFKDKNLPIIGDDIKSQVGATIVNRFLATLFASRGMIPEKMYQLNVGGNTDFLNMLERERLDSKKISKTDAVTSLLQQAGIDIDARNVYIGPSDYVPWLDDNKVCFLRIEGRHFGDIPMNLELRLSVEDSPNSAGIVIDAIRCAKLALDRGIGGPLEAPSAYFMKHPPVQMPDLVARAKLEEFIKG